ncbi:MAG: fused MFS/spermidine synthase [Alphaproteobacteria bacterium]|nr:fused MFS/spermidine synthase [Alphaproteobacteria bacterium]
MKIVNRSLLLFSVILIEGYVVLSSELLAIRQTIPFVGSGTDTVSIIIAAVLMPLAIGYHRGGQFRPGYFRGRYLTIRRKLIFNVAVALAFLLPGLSFGFLYFFFRILLSTGISDRLIFISIYSLIFLVVPIYLLAQTLPLVSNYFPKDDLSKIAGRMLCFSTLGSFVGAVFSTLFLMTILGVHYTASLNFVLLAIVVILLSKNRITRSVLLAFSMAFAGLFLNGPAVMHYFNIVENNQYNTVQVFVRRNGDRNLELNRNHSARYNDSGRKHNYIEFAERLAINPTLASDYKGDPKDVLVVGAGGFTFGHNDPINHYTYVDIDKSLKGVAEEYLLREPIGENKTFVPKPARAYLYSSDKKYDVIFLDAYLGGFSIPEHLSTREFYMQVKSHLKDNGVLIVNFIMQPSFSNQFTRRLDNTFRSVFPYYSREVIDENYFLWSGMTDNYVNVAYIYLKQPDENQGEIYTDDKNTVFKDFP